MNDTERIEALESTVETLKTEVARIKGEHESLLEKTIEPLHELETTVELTRQHTDERLQEILGNSVKVDATDPLLMAMLMRVVEYVDKRDKAIMDGISGVFAKMNATIEGAKE